MNTLGQRELPAMMNIHSPPQRTLANEIKPLEAPSDHTPQLGDVL